MQNAAINRVAYGIRKLLESQPIVYERLCSIKRNARTLVIFPKNRTTKFLAHKLQLGEA